MSVSVSKAWITIFLFLSLSLCWGYVLLFVICSIYFYSFLITSLYYLRGTTCAWSYPTTLLMTGCCEMNEREREKKKTPRRVTVVLYILGAFLPLPSHLPLMRLKPWVSQYHHHREYESSSSREKKTKREEEVESFIYNRGGHGVFRRSDLMSYIVETFVTLIHSILFLVRFCLSFLGCRFVTYL